MISFALAMGLVATTPGAQLPPLVGDPALIELLRDAQATNLAALRSGTMTVRVEWSMPAIDRSVSMEGTMEWTDDRSLWKYRIVDPQGVVTGARGRGTTMAGQPWHYQLRVDGNLISYEPDEATLWVVSEQGRLLRFFELSPTDTWFRCCAPMGRQGGRPWAELIGPHPKFPPDYVESFEVAREGVSRVRLVRHDRDGSTSTSIFDLALCGNVVESRYESRVYAATHVTYGWEKLPGGPCVLRSYVYESSVEGSPDKKASVFKMDVDSIDVATPIPPSRFTQASLRRLLPENITVQDMIANRTIRPKPAAALSTLQLDSLARRVRSEGFLKPD